MSADDHTVSGATPKELVERAVKAELLPADLGHHFVAEAEKMSTIKLDEDEVTFRRLTSKPLGMVWHLRRVGPSYQLTLIGTDLPAVGSFHG